MTEPSKDHILNIGKERYDTEKPCHLSYVECSKLN